MVTTVNIGSGGTDVAISPDGTIVLALSGNDSLYVINVTPGFDQYQVVTTVNIGSGGTDVAISPDGGLAYVTAGDGDNVQVFAIGKANQSGSSSFVPGPAVTLTLVSTVSVGRSPVAVKVVVDDMGRPLAFVANQGSGSVSIIGFGEQVAAIPIQFEFKPNSIKYKEKQMEKLVFGYLVPQPPFFAGQIVVSSIRINGIVPPDTTTHGAQIQIRGPDHLPQLKVYFSRNAVALTLPEGDDVPVVVTGTMAGQPFRGVDSVKVKRPKVKQPKKDDLLPGGQPSLLTWEVPADDSSQYVAILHSVDRGANWILDASELPNTGSYWWTVPDIAADSVKIAVVQVQGIDALETTNPDDPVVIAVLAVSDYFGILATTDVDGAPVSLAFAPISPNPAAGQAHFRFGLPARAQVSLAVYDVLGRRVASVVDAERGPGWHNATWNGRNERGGRVGAGVYFVRFSAAGRTFNHRLVWLR
ncbi:MAG: hypothetical protein A2V63_09035 [Candidatus Eisenbacteria bacterium RBG_19FT_COMBO_70_11]|nr:MAG: hypothetical protein A2V63_09035 [Candidatus Eisenbacteria bacterium RBG_19FT_COMBO_70_11]